MTARCLFVCGALLLLANVANGARYQRTKDGKTLVWNNLRGIAQEATWSGNRDSNEYATGEGTLTWYRVELKILADASARPLRERSVVVNSYTGKMVQGKFEGLVVKEEAGTILHTTFVNGNKSGYWSGEPTTTSKTKESKPVEPAREEPEETAEEPAPSPTAIPSPKEEQWTEPTLAEPLEAPERPAQSPIATATPAEKRPAVTTAPERSAPPVDQVRKETVHESALLAPTRDSPGLELATPPPSLRMTVGAAASPQVFLRSTPTPPPVSPPPADTAVKGGTVADLKEQTQSVLSRVGDATGNFHEIDQLDSVEKLPAPISESVVSLVDRAHERRLELGYEEALKEYGTEIQTADALSVVDQITRNIAFNNAPAANSKLADFLKSNPRPTADSQKPLWRYLTSVQLLCGRLEKEANIHLQRAQSLASAGKSSEAIQEYREANRIFPNPATAEKIRKLSSSQNKPSKP
jgi:hypothetical protein